MFLTPAATGRWFFATIDRADFCSTLEVSHVARVLRAVWRGEGPAGVHALAGTDFNSI
jgi:hypothetical protein